MTQLTSPHSYAETVARLEAELAARPVTVFARIDHAANAAAAGLSMPPALVVVFGNAAAGTPLMLRKPSLALDLPLRILIRADESGAVVVQYHDPAVVLDRHGLPPSEAAALQALPAIAAAVVAPVSSPDGSR